MVAIEVAADQVQTSALAGYCSAFPTAVLRECTIKKGDEGAVRPRSAAIISGVANERALGHVGVESPTVKAATVCSGSVVREAAVVDGGEGL